MKAPKMLTALPTDRGQALNPSNFETLTDGLDYAAGAKTGFNYYSARAELKSTLSFAELREKAIDMAKRLVPFAEKDARIGLCATTSPEFAILLSLIHI